MKKSKIAVVIAAFAVLAVATVIFFRSIAPTGNTPGDNVVVVDPTPAPSGDIIVQETPKPGYSDIGGITPDPLPPQYSTEPFIDAFKVMVDHKCIGIVTSEDAVDEIIEKLTAEFSNSQHSDDVVCEVIKKIEIKKTQTFSNNITDSEQLEECISECVTFKLNAFSLSVDGYHIGYFATEDECQQVIDTAKNKLADMYFAGKKLLSISFDREFDIKSTVVTPGVLSDDNAIDAVDMIISSRLVEKMAVVYDASSLEQFYKDNSVTAPAFDSALEDINTTGSANIFYEERLINVTAKVESSKVTSIPYSTTYTTNNKLSHKTSRIKTAGVNGSLTTYYEDTYVNGEYISSQQTSQKKKNPTTQVIEYGTALGIYEYVSAFTGKGTFMWPTSGQIFQHFSWKNNKGHTGIDIAAARGTPIYAAAAGTVTFACANGAKCKCGWGATWGNHVTIKHNSTYSTAYAHMLSYVVKQGQHVEKGQLIGYVGMTGIATGNHLHFSVFKNGSLINPTYVMYGY